MLRSPSRPALCAAVLAASLALAACGGGRGAAAAPSVDPTAAHLQDQLDVLPQVDGARRTADRFSGDSLTESFTVPAGSPACLQLLARLDAGGYQVVAGTGASAVVDPATCRTAAGTDGIDTGAGTATILARGGSEIALTWSATSYTLTVSTS